MLVTASDLLFVVVTIFYLGFQILVLSVPSLSGPGQHSLIIHRLD